MRDFKAFVNKTGLSRKDSLELLSKAKHTLKIHPNCLDAAIVAGDIYYGFDSLDAASVYLKYAISIDSLKVYPFYQMGVVSYFDSNFVEAAYYLNKAISLKQKDGVIFDDAIAFMNEDEAKYDVLSSELFYWAGLSYYAANDFANSVACFTFCINQKYNESDSYMYRGLSSFYGGDRKAGCSDLFSAFSLGSQKAGQYFNEMCK